MRKLMLLGVLSSLLVPGLAQAQNGNSIGAGDMGQLGLAGAALLGVVGHLALRRKRRLN